MEISPAAGHNPCVTVVTAVSLNSFRVSQFSFLPTNAHGNITAGHNPCMTGVTTVILLLLASQAAPMEISPQVTDA